MTIGSDQKALVLDPVCAGGGRAGENLTNLIHIYSLRRPSASNADMLWLFTCFLGGTVELRFFVAARLPACEECESPVGTPVSVFFDTSSSPMERFARISYYHFSTLENDPLHRNALALPMQLCALKNVASDCKSGISGFDGLEYHLQR
ncbi:hypothetical protein K439DRAFT_978704 [Ramaria rubella]|nr:hypothetical protein K439DRAFT_978704 [Ramaria rubella]